MGTEGAHFEFFRCTQAPQQLPTAAVCIKRVDGKHLHIGVGYRTDNDARLLHLAWHMKLTSSKLCADTSYIGVVTNLPEIRQEEVSLLCERIFDSNGRKIPYAFGAPNGCIDGATGRVLFGPTALGLTCATFVLAVFEAVGISLLRYQDWPEDREGDDEWRKSVLDALSANPANKEHVEAIKACSPGVRYRPDDVGAGAAAFPPSVSFDSARAFADAIAAELA